jgi:hypothetical protein
VLARKANAPIGSAPEANYGDNTMPTRMQQFGRVWVYTLTATARLSNEGEKPLLAYTQPDYRDSGSYIPEPSIPGRGAGDRGSAPASDRSRDRSEGTATRAEPAGVAESFDDDIPF